MRRNRVDLDCRSHSIGRLPTPLFSSSVISESTAARRSVGVFLDAYFIALGTGRFPATTPTTALLLVPLPGGSR